MILPNKHLKIHESLIFLSGLIINDLTIPSTIENIWKKIEQLNKKHSKKYNTIYTFEKVLKAIDLLYILGLIEMKDDGLLEKCV